MNSINNYINSELEYGLRAVILVSELSECDLSFEKLIIFDYILTNINDFDEMMESVHPQTPYRYAKLIVKRKAYKTGLNYCISKNLINVKYCSKGILYEASYITTKFLKHLESEYVKKLIKCSSRIKELYGTFSLDDLQQMIDEKVKENGIEFHMIND